LLLIDHNSITAGNVIEKEEDDNDQGNDDIPFELPFLLSSIFIIVQLFV
jgi:hypothetical protein